MRASPRLHYSLRALGGRMGDQWERDRRDTLFLMAGTLLAATPHFLFRPWWASVGFLVLFFWRLGLVLSGRWLPRDSVRWVAAIACTAAVYAHYDTLLGREAGVTLLMLFLGLKLMEMRVRRDLFVVLFLCFFLLLTAFFNSQSITTATLTVLAVLVLVATMVTIQFGQQEAPVARRVRTAGALMLQALPIAAVLFVLFPRLQEPLWGMPEDPHAARTGLSESMSPGNISKLSGSDEVAFRVKFDGRMPALGEMYWRGPVLGQFDGHVWRPITQPTVATPPLRLAIDEPARRIRYQLTLEPTHRRWLFALEAPLRVQGIESLRPTVFPDLQLTADHPVSSRIRYDVESSLAFRLGENETPESLRDATRLPRGFNPRAIELGRQWANAGLGPQEIVDRALAMFREQPFRYTLEPPLTGRHGVDDFLLKTRAGFCEHYSAAFVVLMRAAGVPARVVTGYQGGEINPIDDYLIVRQADAHAWSEVWIDGQGWTRIDPVTAVAPDRIEHGSRMIRDRNRERRPGAVSAWSRRWQLNLDAWANNWNQWVLSYDGSRQRRLLGSLGFAFEDWREMAGLLAASLTLLIGIAALITLHPRTPKDPVERCYREFCDRLAAVGMLRARHETATRFVDRIAPALDDPQLAQARRIVSLYNNLRYGARAPQPPDVQHLSTLVTRFKP